MTRLILPLLIVPWNQPSKWEREMKKRKVNGMTLFESFELAKKIDGF